MHDNGIIDLFISKVEDERTSVAKTQQHNHTHSDKVVVQPSVIEKGKRFGQTVATAARRLFRQIQKGTTKRVRFSSRPGVCNYVEGQESIMITYDSGADGHYMSEDDRAKL